MRTRDPEVVSASEVASWAWCPESWRLESLGHEPGNNRDLRRGERRHAFLARFEMWSVAATRLGVRLLVLGLLLALAALAFVLVRG